MAFPFTEDTVIDFLQKGTTQKQIDEIVSGNFIKMFHIIFKGPEKLFHGICLNIHNEINVFGLSVIIPFIFFVGLKAKKQNVSELVAELNPVLCAKENDIRLIGTNFFVDILKGLDSNDLNEEEIKVIWSFFTDRLNDHHSIIPTILSGGIILSKSYVSSTKYFAKFLSKMFQSVVCQTQKREDREKIFIMLKIASESMIEGMIILFSFYIPF